MITVADIKRAIQDLPDQAPLTIREPGGYKLREVVQVYPATDPQEVLAIEISDVNGEG